MKGAVMTEAEFQDMLDDSEGWAEWHWTVAHRLGIDDKVVPLFDMLAKPDISWMEVALVQGRIESLVQQAVETALAGVWTTC